MADYPLTDHAQAVVKYKNIILFSDGTGNSSAKLFKTNVWWVYQAVDLTDPKNPTEPRQFALYDNGVGSSSFKPLAALGGALGVGLARNVRDLYAFVCRIYQPARHPHRRPEEQDRIYAFGFSRGAFTMRVLVGLIMDQGLVPYDGNEADLDRYAAAAYRAYRKTCKTTGGLVGPLRGLRDAVIDRRPRPSSRAAPLPRRREDRWAPIGATGEDRVPWSVGYGGCLRSAGRRTDPSDRSVHLAAHDARSQP